VVRDPTALWFPRSDTLKNTVKGTVRVTSTDIEGRYNLTSVEPGTYELRAESAGFRTEIKNGRRAGRGRLLRGEYNPPGRPTNEVVTVTGEAPLIEASKAEVSNVINQQAIESLPKHRPQLRGTSPSSPACGAGPGEHRWRAHSKSPTPRWAQHQRPVSPLRQSELNYQGPGGMAQTIPRILPASRS